MSLRYLSNPESLLDSTTLKTLKQRVLKYFAPHPDRPTSRNSPRRLNALPSLSTVSHQSKIPAA